MAEVKKRVVVTNTTYRKSFLIIKNALFHCIKMIDKIKMKKNFYIGASEDPEIRKKQHINDGKKVKIMYILATMYTLKQSRSLERQLLEKYKKDKNCINKDDDSVGLTKKTNTIYLLICNRK